MCFGYKLLLVSHDLVLFSLSCSEYVIPSYSQMTLRGEAITLWYNYRNQSVWLCSLDPHCRPVTRPLPVEELEAGSSHKAVLVIQRTSQYM